MKTAISLPDPLFAAADLMAARQGKSRSQLYAEALAEYLTRHDDDAITEALNGVYGRDRAPDPALQGAARRLLLSEPW